MRVSKMSLQQVVIELEAARQERPLDHEKIERLVSKRPQAAEKRGNDGWLPIHRVCRRQPSIATIKCLVKAFPDSLLMETGDGLRELGARIPLHLACQYGASFEVIEYLIRKKPDTVQKACRHYQMMPLDYALEYKEDALANGCKNDNQKVIELLESKIPSFQLQSKKVEDHKTPSKTKTRSPEASRVDEPATSPSHQGLADTLDASTDLTYLPSLSTAKGAEEDQTAKNSNEKKAPSVRFSILGQPKPLQAQNLLDNQDSDKEEEEEEGDELCSNEATAGSSSDTVPEGRTLERRDPDKTPDATPPILKPASYGRQVSDATAATTFSYESDSSREKSVEIESEEEEEEEEEDTHRRRAESQNRANPRLRGDPPAMRMADGLEPQRKTVPVVATPVRETPMEEEISAEFSVASCAPSERSLLMATPIETMPQEEQKDTHSKEKTCEVPDTRPKPQEELRDVPETHPKPAGPSSFHGIPSFRSFKKEPEPVFASKPDTTQDLLPLHVIKDGEVIVYKAPKRGANRPQGSSPSGSLSIRVSNTELCPGFSPPVNCISLLYKIRGGTQAWYHYHSGKPFAGTERFAYLPNNESGCRLLTRLLFAWKRGLTFTVGYSQTHAMHDRVVWDAIPMKTSLQGDQYGFPDPDFIRTCHEALNKLNVPNVRRDGPPLPMPPLKPRSFIHSFRPSMHRYKCPQTLDLPEGFGASPSGTLTTRATSEICPGFGAGTNSIELCYEIQAGTQQQYHPTPSMKFEGTTRIAYLPLVGEGVELMHRLICAWKRGLVFEVGQSQTSGHANVVKWAATIPHKTSLRGGKFGFPDDDFLLVCNSALDTLHVPLAPQVLE